MKIQIIVRFFFTHCLIWLFIAKITAQSAKVIRVDPSNIQGARFSQIFDSIEYIPLETNRISLFGQIDKLLITEKYYIILDHTSTNSILIFDKSGRFHAKIKGDSFQILPYFSFDSLENRLVVYFLKSNAQNRGNLLHFMNENLSARYYDLDGTPLNTKVEKKIISVNAFQSLKLSRGYSANSCFLPDKTKIDSVMYQLSIINHNKVYRSYFPFQTGHLFSSYEDHMAKCFPSNKNNDTTFYFTRPFDYCIYKISPNTIRQLYKFIFPIFNTIPRNYFADSVAASYKERQKYIQTNPDKIKNLDNLIIYNNFLFFNISSSQDELLYSLNSGTLFSLQKLMPDNLTSYLHLFGDKYNMKRIQAADSTHIYVTLSSLEMFQGKELTKGKHPSYPLVLQRYYAQEDRKSNPVIVRLKVKKHL